MSIKDLKEEALSLGLSFSPNIGEETLRKKISDFRIAQETVQELQGMSTEDLNQRLKNEALVQVRIELTCMNPAKAKHQGDILMASNSNIGTIKKYVPFNTPWHIPQILLNVAEEKQFTMHDSKNNRRRWVKEYQIRVLPPLSVEELDDLKNQQAILDKTQGD